MFKILKNEKNKLLLEVDDTTIACVISDYISKVKGVNFATFIKEHPYLENPKILISATNPLRAFQEGIKKLINDIEKLESQLK
jgi:DNA-directed RNA polymerase subunit L